MRKELEVKINEYVKKNTNMEELTSKKLADYCGVSQSTITRYVQGLGYRNLEEFRFSVLEINKEKMQKRNSYKFEKLNVLEYNLENIDIYTTDEENEKIIYDMSKNKKILVCYDLKYEKIAESFVEKMNILHGNIIVFKNESGLNYLLEKYNRKCTIVSIGDVSSKFYHDDIQHLEVKYASNATRKKRKNLVYFHLQDDQPSKEKNIITLNNLGIFIILEMLVEEYTNRVLAKEEIKRIEKHLL